MHDLNLRVARLGGVLILLLWAGTHWSRAQDTVGLNVDYAVFAYSDSTSLLELYFAFDAASLPFESVETGRRTSIPITLTLMPDGDESEPVWTDSLALQFTVSDTSQPSSGQMFLHQVRTSIPPGAYVLAIDQPETAASPPAVRSIDRELTVADYTASAEAQFSDIALAARIHQSRARQSPFYKHGLVVRPNPRLVYGPGLSRLYYYVELYHPGAAEGVEDSYQLYSYITPVHQTKPLKDLERSVDREVRSPDVVVGQFNVGGLASGTYELHTEMRTNGGSVVTAQGRRFFVYNPAMTPEKNTSGAAPSVSARYRSMNEEMVDIAAAAAAEIASDAERGEIAQLEDAEEKRRFLTRFWARRDETPATAENERENQFYRSLRVVRQQYDSPFREAWATDRGRTMLRYGPPSQIDSYLHQRETQPYIVWHYDHIPGEGEARFVFIDRQGFGEFDLVHATARGEVKNPEWRRLIQ